MTAIPYWMLAAQNYQRKDAALEEVDAGQSLASSDRKPASSPALQDGVTGKMVTGLGMRVKKLYNTLAYPNYIPNVIIDFGNDYTATTPEEGS